ncbi:DEAD/DEAH box helicase [Alkanindiges illinoisensis]|uniref:DEAD/DEAH box helicase n=1 Tax=Alkanindiges illinoisensis TaxID=197183 RepID=UPI000A01278C|nr:DEAD/DEAH box helicase [Alkanindiges illinoisensis]
MSNTFADFPLAEQYQKALNDLGFTAPTPVQAAAIPAALDGKDLLVSSQTGSGKTVAFLLPTLNPLATTNQLQSAKDRMKSVTAPQVLVLCPTRELAQQVSQDAIALVRHVRGLRIATIVGGMPFGKQIAQLKGAQVVVATPGRLLDLVNRRQLSLHEVDALIVDEADRMLDLGFSEDLEAISDLAANRKQTLMFSATFADRIIRLAEKMMNEPERIAIETGSSTNVDIEQTLHWTDGFEHKKKLLAHWLSDETMDQAVVFASTQEDTDMLAEELAEAGHQVVALHGAMPQTVRNRRIKSLRDGRARVLVATDVAARGLDVPGISHVINFGLPMKNEDYVHRIGRTGRAGRSGRAITLALHRERGKIRGLEEYLSARLAVTEIAGLEPSPPPERPRGAGRGNGNGRGGRPGGGGRRFEGESRFGSGERRPFNRDGADRSDSRPARPFNRDGGDQRRSFGNSEGGERRPFNRDGADRSDSRPARPFNRDGGDQRRSFGNDDNRGNRVDYRSERPARSFGNSEGGERRPFNRDGDRPARPFNRDGGDQRRSFGNSEGGERRPFNRDGGERRSFGGDRSDSRPVRREFGGERSFGAEHTPNVERKTRRFKEQAYANKARANNHDD